MEFNELKEWLHDPLRPAVGATFFLYIMTGGLLGFTYDLVHQQFIKVTSSMSMGIAGNAKMVLLIIISMIFFEHPPTATGIIGILIGLAGCFWYTAYKLNSAPPPKAKTEESTPASATEKTGLVKP